MVRNFDRTEMFKSALNGTTFTTFYVQVPLFRWSRTQVRTSVQ